MSIERSALDALVERFARAWNDRDIAALSAALSEDAEFLDSAGKIWRGRPAIIAEHRRIFKHASAQSMLRFQTAKVRLLSRTTALIYAIWSITGNATGARRTCRCAPAFGCSSRSGAAPHGRSLAAKFPIRLPKRLAHETAGRS